MVWDSETVDSEAYHTGDIVSSEDGYYPSSFYLYVDSAEENGITVTGGTCLRLWRKRRAAPSIW